MGNGRNGKNIMTGTADKTIYDMLSLSKYTVIDSMAQEAELQTSLLPSASVGERLTKKHSLD